MKVADEDQESWMQKLTGWKILDGVEVGGSREEQEQV